MKILKLLMILLVIMILTLALAFFLSWEEGNTCLQNPFIYGAKKVSGGEVGDIRCTCMPSNPKYSGFTFDKDNLTQISLSS